MYSSGMFFVYLFSSALAFALVNRVLRHRLTWLSALSVLTALGWGYIFQGDYIVPAAVFFSFYVFATQREGMVKNVAGGRSDIIAAAAGENYI
jgi:membrane protein involved in D-alanine export